jgi:hypothetical protein
MSPHIASTNPPLARSANPGLLPVYRYIRLIATKRGNTPDGPSGFAVGICRPREIADRLLLPYLF